MAPGGEHRTTGLQDHRTVFRRLKMAFDFLIAVNQPKAGLEYVFAGNSIFAHGGHAIPAWTRGYLGNLNGPAAPGRKNDFRIGFENAFHGNDALHSGALRSQFRKNIPPTCPLNQFTHPANARNERLIRGRMAS